MHSGKKMKILSGKTDTAFYCVKFLLKQNNKDAKIRSKKVA